ncbi:type VI secretion system lipoprotein TssJ [Microbulbifer harenosus]|uniref:Type VI secretion system lipoprotein TssJ n=1 Tax=Microbulbifer harenosus TaxID=2576840 RepID=A0ABY2UIR0_9GAMM|nr:MULTISPECIES: type VI secretion system lipoprotein TssJ [Microbulbifer]QIL90443.1 type VI secretion system lipoprotein TssJ [Microbulbifer sp. SH-1]TLM77956.1 type VI secretion system lipoprotein TssJ [Microbulbifer harenosus]
MNIQKLLQLLLVSLLAIALSACQTTRRTLNLDTSLALDVNIASDVNPDSDGRASPVVLRVFMLADDRQFSREEFLNLYENAQSRLGKDLIDTVILKEFAPGEQRIEQLALTPEVKYIGLLAEFVQYQQADALMLLPITDHKKNTYAISLAGTRMASTEALDMRRRSTAANTKKKKEDTVTISSAEYERLRKAQ